MKKLISIILTICCVLTLVSCGEQKTSEAETEAPITTAAETTETEVESSDASTIEIESTVTKDQKYGSATVALSQAEFEAAGFQLGDSVDIAFESGHTMEDVPYYNGYYVQNKAPVVVAYPGFSNISITYNNMGIWDNYNLVENEKVTIRLNTAQKYAAVQEVLGQVYSFDITEYTDAKEFCNFRALSGGNLKENFFYRGASPVDNSRNRAPYTDELLKETGIQFIVDLADSEDDLAGYRAKEDFNSPYTASLYDQGRMVLLAMSSSYQSEAYQQKLVAGLRAMMSADGPVYIHCMEGKDRTGFVCLILEALAGATYDELQADYMMTYENYYTVSEEDTPEKYQAIVDLYFEAFVDYFNDLIIFLHGSNNLLQLQSATYVEDAAKYLTAGGMTEEEITQLKAYISK